MMHAANCFLTHLTSTFLDALRPKCAVVALVCLSAWLGANAQDAVEDEITVVKRYQIGLSAPTEDASMARLRHVADSLLTATRLTSVTIEGYSSPDGPQDLNRRLALNRSKRIRSYLVDNTAVPAALITVSSHPEDWEGFRAAVEAADDMADRDKVLALIDDVSDRDACEKELRRLSGGLAWRQMARDIFPSLRRTVVTFRFPGRAVEVVIPEDESYSTPPPRQFANYQRLIG